MTVLFTAQCGSTNGRAGLGKRPLHSSKRAIKLHAVAPKQHFLRSQTEARFAMLSGPLGRPNGRLPFFRGHEHAPIFLRRKGHQQPCTDAPMVLSLAIREHRSRVGLASCTTHAAEESAEQAAMLQVRGVRSSHNGQTILLVESSQRRTSSGTPCASLSGR